MKDEASWKIFCKTGNVEDYLNYACTNEESQQKGHTQVGCENDAGKRDGNGSSVRASW